MFVFQGKGESVNDRTENFQQLGDTIMPFSLVYELEEDIVDRSSNEGSEIKEFTVDPMKGGFEEVSLARVFAVEKVKQLLYQLCEFHNHWDRNTHGENE